MTVVRKRLHYLGYFLFSDVEKSYFSKPCLCPAGLGGQGKGGPSRDKDQEGSCGGFRAHSFISLLSGITALPCLFSRVSKQLLLFCSVFWLLTWFTTQTNSETWKSWFPTYLLPKHNTFCEFLVNPYFGSKLCKCPHGPSHSLSFFTDDRHCVGCPAPCLCLGRALHTLPRARDPPLAFKKKKLFIYLVVPGLSCSTWALQLRLQGSLVAARGFLNCGMQTLSCGIHVGSSSLFRDRTQAPCIGTAESYPLRHQGSPSSCFLCA